jgi:hypothetical protein
MRNPRRAYTPDGSEIPPLTLGGMRALGVRTIDAYCECGHGAHGISVEAVPDDVPVPDLAIRLLCSACGSKNVRSRPNWSEYRAVGHGIAGTGSHAFL